MSKIVVRRKKRFLWHPDDINAYYSDDYSDDYFSDDERAYKYGRPRPTPMASLLNLRLSEYELIRFYNNETTPLLVAATGRDAEAQGLWMSNVTKLANSNAALKEICMAFATMHLGHNRKTTTYVLRGGEEGAQGSTDLTQVIGYTRLEEEVLEQMFVRLTNAVRAHKEQIRHLTVETYESVLLSSVLIYMLAMSMGPYVPLFNFEGGADLFSLGRSIHDLSFVLAEEVPTFNHDFDEPLNVEREKLPREEDLWAIIDFVDTDEELSSSEKRRIKHILTAELKNLIGLFIMDVEAFSVSHIAAWCTFWTPNFYTLLREEMNTYALLFVCYWCGYAHMWHVLFWWGDRIQEDLLHLKENLPERVHHFLEWPMQSCTRFDINYVELLNGKMRDLYI